MRNMIIIFLLCISFSLNNYKLPEDNSLNLSNVWKEINKVGILFPHIVYAQCRLETGNLQFVHSNNLFGFTNYKYIAFKDWKESIKFYKEWQVKYYTNDNYYQFLSTIGYASDKQYIKKLKQFK